MGDDDGRDGGIGIEASGYLVGVGCSARRKLDLDDVDPEALCNLREALSEVTDGNQHCPLARREQDELVAARAVVVDPGFLAVGAVPGDVALEEARVDPPEFFRRTDRHRRLRERRRAAAILEDATGIERLEHGDDGLRARRVARRAEEQEHAVGRLHVLGEYASPLLRRQHPLLSQVRAGEADGHLFGYA